MTDSRAPHRSDRIQVQTFLMTDIEGSARLWDEEPGLMGSALAEHDVLIRVTIEAFGGRVIKSKGEGDSSLSVLPDAMSAIEAALLLQRRLKDFDWPTQQPLTVRMAIETGEVEARDEDFYGPTLNRCARLRGAAHGGQILVSEAVGVALSTSSTDSFSLRDLGLYRLKGLNKELRVLQVQAPDLPDEFPALRAIDIQLHNLRQEVAPPIDRSQDIIDLQAKVASSRLITLWGPGGAGKTHLSLQLARQTLDLFKDGVWFIELSTVSDPQLVAERVAEVLGITRPESMHTPAELSQALGNRELLLILDNCEHLRDAVAETVRVLLAGTAAVKAIATSREPLGVAGETVYRVGGLSLPDPGQPPQESQAVQLFFSRAFSSCPDVALEDPEAIRAVEAICRRVEGLPLAIELAAGALTTLDVNTLLDQLDARFDILDAASSTGSATPTGRDTMSGTINWSYSLATEEQRRVLRRLSVLTGSFSLEAAIRVATTDVGSVLALTRQSLLAQDGGTGRYRLLEPIRYFAESLLIERGESAEATASFLAWMRDLALPSQPIQSDWLGCLEVEIDNLRGALRRAQTSDHDSFAVLVNSVTPFWKLRGHLKEGRDWIELALGLPSKRPVDVQGWLHANHGLLSFWLGDLELSLDSSRRAVTLAREIEALGLQASALNMLGLIKEAMDLGSEARSHYEAAAEIAGEGGEGVTQANALSNLGVMVLQVDKDLQTASQLYERSLSIRRRIDDVHGIAVSLHNLGEISGLEGDTTRALELWLESLEIFLRLGDPYSAAMTVNMMALTIAPLDPARAATCFGAAESVLQLLDIADSELQTLDASKRERCLTTLGEERFAELHAVGSAMSLEEAGQHASRFTRSSVGS